MQDGKIGEREGSVGVRPRRQQRADHQLGMFRSLDGGVLAGIGDGRGEACLDPGSETGLHGLGIGLNCLAFLVVNPQGERPLEPEIVPVVVNDQLAALRRHAVPRDYRQLVGRYLSEIRRLEVDGLTELGAFFVGGRAANIDDVGHEGFSVDRTLIDQPPPSLSPLVAYRPRV